jgi:aminomethyltransferase
VTARARLREHESAPFSLVSSIQDPSQKRTVALSHETTLRHTPLHARHLAFGAKMQPFAGWHMPIMYPEGVIAEHLATRREAGLFDVSHMGRFALRGPGTVHFLQHLLTNNVQALDIDYAQHSFISDPGGAAIDDAYLYRLGDEEYLLCVNAANRNKDWAYLQEHLPANGSVELTDRTEELAMLSLQGPRSRDILMQVLSQGTPPEPRRNALSHGIIGGHEVLLSRTGYTGEPLCFELVFAAEAAEALWDLLIREGAQPVGLGARDTLRLEASLPLYGNELGVDPAGRPIEIFASPLALFSVNFSDQKGSYVGREALARQHAALRGIMAGNYSFLADLPRRIRSVVLTGRGVARAGAKLSLRGENAGWVTSGTMVPYWRSENPGLDSRVTSEYGMRAICLALLDSRVNEGDEITVNIRGKEVPGIVVPRHMRSDTPPYARPVLYG